MKVLLDPSFLLSRRGSDWVSRVEKRGEQGGLVFPQRFLELQNEYEVMRQFRAPFWGSMGPAYGSQNPPKTRQVLGLRAFRAEIQASGFGLAAEIAVDCLVNLRHGDTVLVARRRDMLDLVNQVGVPLLQRGRDSFEGEFTARLRDSFSETLIDALHRRTRYLAWVDQTQSHIVQVADVGRGRTY